MTAPRILQGIYRTLTRVTTKDHSLATVAANGLSERIELLTLAVNSMYLHSYCAM
jgi:hypothetical protein